MKALVAVSDTNGALILRVWPPDTGPDSPWGCEFEAVGCNDLDDMGLSYPKKVGFWIWEGHIDYKGIEDEDPEWIGDWRRAELNDISIFLENIE